VLPVLIEMVAAPLISVPESVMPAGAVLADAAEQVIHFSVPATVQAASVKSVPVAVPQDHTWLTP